MDRISTNLINQDMQFHLRNREYKMNELQNKMATQSRIQNLRDDPVSAAHSTRYQSYAARLERFSVNVEYAMSNHTVTEGYMTESLTILHRVRELGIQGANGTYSAQDLKAMGQEMNQLLNELVELANARNGDGTMVFAGSKSRTIPFRAVEGNVPGADGSVITDVQYIGDITSRFTEISEGSYMQLNFPGNEVFWAENQQIFSQTDAGAYQVQEDSVIRIDGTAVDLNAGDNIHAVISKINSSDAAVKARLDPVMNSLVLETTMPHQLWVEDGGSGKVLEDLGIIKGNGSEPPHNIDPTARRFGGSLFDMVIYMRDTLYEGNHLDAGGSALRGIDSAMDNMLSSLGNIGAQYSRLEIVSQRITKELPEIQDMNSKEIGIDFTKAVTDLKMLEYTHKAALATAGRILQPTLLDFLR